MFINPSKFEKALKRAYGYQGIMAYRGEELLAIDAGEWCCEMRMSRLPKEVHAAMIKTVGWLPMAGEAYKYIKGQPEQMTMMEAVGRAGSRRQTAGELLLVDETPILLKIKGSGQWRVMQTENGACFEIPEDLFEMVDPSKTGAEETMPAPYFHMGRVVWANDVMTLTIDGYKGETGLEDQVTRGLEMLDADLRSANWTGRWVAL